MRLTIYDQDPAQRKMRVLTIGAGVSGILIAYQLQKHCQNVELKIIECARPFPFPSHPLSRSEDYPC